MKMLKYLRGFAILMAILAPLLMFGEVIMDLFQPTLLNNVIVNGIGENNTDYIIKMGLVMLLLAVVGIICGAGSGLCASIAGAKLGESLRERLFNKVQDLSYQEIDKLKTSSIITRITNDVQQIQTLITFVLKIIIRAPFTCIGGLFFAYNLSKELSIIPFVGIPFILVIVLLVLFLVFPLFKQVQTKIDNLNLVMRENLLGMRVVKSFNLEDEQTEIFNEKSTDLMNKSIQAQSRIIILFPLVTLVLNYSILLVFWLGANQPISNIEQTANITTFVTYISQILMSLIMVVMLSIQIARGSASSARIEEVLKMENTLLEPENPKDLLKYDIEFKNVSFSYNNTEECAIDNVSFKVKQGEKIGIIGPTGSGKSTLVLLIPRLYDVTSGEIKIGGTNIKDYKFKELREHVGIVLQDSTIFSGTIRSNIEFGKSLTEKELDEAVKTSQAISFITEKGYEEKIEQRGKNLSGGQKQRLSIARTISRKPSILILDDSHSALDMQTSKNLEKALKEYQRNQTVITIAQRVSSIMNCDKILVLEDGKLSGYDTHENLLKTNKTYNLIAKSQLGEDVINNE